MNNNFKCISQEQYVIEFYNGSYQKKKKHNAVKGEYKIKDLPLKLHREVLLIKIVIICNKYMGIAPLNTMPEAMMALFVDLQHQD